MPDETENHTLRLLREMREENNQFREEVQAFQKETRGRFEQLDRIEAAVVGISYFQASERGEVATEIEEIKARLERLENKLGLSGEPAQ